MPESASGRGGGGVPGPGGCLVWGCVSGPGGGVSGLGGVSGPGGWCVWSGGVPGVGGGVSCPGGVSGPGGVCVPGVGGLPQCLVGYHHHHPL